MRSDWRANHSHACCYRSGSGSKTEWNWGGWGLMQALPMHMGVRNGAPPQMISACSLISNNLTGHTAILSAMPRILLSHTFQSTHCWEREQCNRGHPCWIEVPRESDLFLSTWFQWEMCWAKAWEPKSYHCHGEVHVHMHGIYQRVHALQKMASNQKRLFVLVPDPGYYQW